GSAPSSSSVNSCPCQSFSAICTAAVSAWMSSSVIRKCFGNNRELLFVCLNRSREYICGSLPTMFTYLSNILLSITWYLLVFRFEVSCTRRGSPHEIRLKTRIRSLRDQRSSFLGAQRSDSCFQ